MIAVGAGSNLVQWRNNRQFAIPNSNYLYSFFQLGPLLR
jgi:hypothetical protein